MFENEVQNLMRLDHPHIVKLVEYFDEEDDVVRIFGFRHSCTKWTTRLIINVDGGMCLSIYSAQEIPHWINFLDT